MGGESTHVQFVDDRILERRQRRNVLLPLKRAAKKDAAPYGAVGVALGREPPDGAVGKSGAGGIEEHLGRVEAMAGARRTVHAPAVAEGRR
jgi:hypothetical protein